MFRLFRKNDDPPPRRWFFGGQTSLSARLAWLVLVLAVTFVILRMSIATIVSVHGDGMAPTILDGDHVLMIRGTWGLQRGDVLVYQPRDTTTYYAERAEQPNELESALLD